MRLGRPFAERLFVCSLISLSKSCAAASFSRASSFVRGILVQSEFLFSSFARLERMPRNCGRGWAVRFTQRSKKWWKCHWQWSAGRGEQRYKPRANSFLCNCITWRRKAGPSNINDKKPGVNRGGKKLLYSQPLWFRYKVRFVQGIEVNMGFSFSCVCTFVSSLFLLTFLVNRRWHERLLHYGTNEIEVFLFRSHPMD